MAIDHRLGAPVTRVRLAPQSIFLLRLMSISVFYVRGGLPAVQRTGRSVFRTRAAIICARPVS